MACDHTQVTSSPVGGSTCNQCGAYLFRKIFLAPELITPIVMKLAARCPQNGAAVPDSNYRLELNNPIDLKWYVCDFVSLGDFNAGRAIRTFATRIFEELADSSELPPSPSKPESPISREDMIENLVSIARFRTPGEGLSVAVHRHSSE